jgi:hypothetical protein
MGVRCHQDVPLRPTRCVQAGRFAPPWAPEEGDICRATRRTGMVVSDLLFGRCVRANPRAAWSFHQ